MKKRELKPVIFHHKNGSLTFFQKEKPKSFALGDIWMNPDKDEWANTIYKMYNERGVYDIYLEN